jgi:hypothetical protein
MAVTAGTASSSAASALAAWRRRMLTIASRLTIPMPHASHAVHSTSRADTSTWPPKTSAAGSTMSTPVTACAATDTLGSATVPQRFCKTVALARPSMPTSVTATPTPTRALPSFGREADRHAHDADRQPRPQARITALLAAADRQASRDQGDRPSMARADSAAGTPRAKPPYTPPNWTTCSSAPTAASRPSGAPRQRPERSASGTATRAAKVKRSASSGSGSASPMASAPTT